MTGDPGARTILSGETTRQRRKKQRPPESRLELATKSACRHDRNHDLHLSCSAEAAKTANGQRSLGRPLKEMGHDGESPHLRNIGGARQLGANGSFQDDGKQHLLRQ